MPGARILLVEDDEVLRELILRNLEARDHDVCVAADAHTALTHLRTAPFDLILLDICLPDQTGWDVLRVAQKEGELSPVEMKGTPDSCPSWCFRPCGSACVACRNFTRWRICPSPSRWMPSAPGAEAGTPKRRSGPRTGRDESAEETVPYEEDDMRNERQMRKRRFVIFDVSAVQDR